MSIYISTESGELLDLTDKQQRKKIADEVSDTDYSHMAGEHKERAHQRWLSLNEFLKTNPNA